MHCSSTCMLLVQVQTNRPNPQNQFLERSEELVVHANWNFYTKINGRRCLLCRQVFFLSSRYSVSWHITNCFTAYLQWQVASSECVMAGITKQNDQGRPVQQEVMKHNFTAIWALPCVWALGKTECSPARSSEHLDCYWSNENAQRINQATFYKTPSHFMKTAGSFLEEKTRTGGSLIPKFSKNWNNWR